MVVQNSKNFLGVLVVILAAGVIVLGYEVQKLRAEAIPVSGLATAAVGQVRPQVSRPDTWGVTSNDRRDIYAEMNRMQKQMDRLLGDTFRSSAGNGWLPAADIYELSSGIKDNKDNYVISMDIPGMEKDSVNVEVRNSTLLVSGERNSSSEDKNANYYRQERGFGYFSESFSLPADANSTGISAEYQKGVLTINVPKLAQADATENAPLNIKVN